MSPPATWNARMMEMLAALHAKGLTFRVIAETLVRELGVAVTRNACIGKARRMGLSKVERPKPPPSPLRPRILQWKPKPKPPSAPDTRPGFRNLTFRSLRAGDCRFANNARPFLFCGQPIQHGSSWCPVHHRVVYPTRAAAR